jgi:regulatory protein
MPSAAAKRQPLSLKARALALLAQREQSVSEIRRKLLRHLRATSQPASAGVLAAEVDPIPVEDDGEARVDEVIDWLRANNYLSEERFVESRVNARAMEVWRKKFAHPPADAAEKARHARFLSQRGFSPDVISKVLRSARTAGTAETSD